MRSFTADHYAWFFTWNWFYYSWSWTSDGSDNWYTCSYQIAKSATTKRQTAETDIDDLPGPDGDDTDASLIVLPDALPVNIHVIGTTTDGYPLATFDYVGEDYDDFVAELGDSFTAPNSTCILS